MDEDNYNFIKNIPAGNSPVGIDVDEKKDLVYSDKLRFKLTFFDKWN